MARPPRARPVEFERTGVAGPLRVLDVRAAMLALGAMQVELHARQRPDQPPVLSGWHEWSPWVEDIAAQPALIRAVETSMGAPCQLWASELWVKTPHSPIAVPWHQDDVFWPSAAELPTVSAWVALTEASASNGGLALVRGSHQRTWEHLPVDASRGGLDHGIDPTTIPPEQVWIPQLSPGEAVLFDSRVVHGSAENRSTRIRVGLSLRYTLAGLSLPASDERADAGSSTYDQQPPA